MKKSLHVAIAGLILLLSSAAKAEDQFFPPGVWGKPAPHLTQAEHEQFYEEWFGNRLRREKEKPLWVHRAKIGATLSIRMSEFRGAVIPDFEMIRVDVSPAGEMSYYIRAYDLCRVGQRSDVAGLSCQKRSVERGSVDPTLAVKIEALVKKIAPFTTRTASRSEVTGMDGDTTVFEFSADGRFNAMQRWELGNTGHGPLAELSSVLHQLDAQR